MPELTPQSLANTINLGPHQTVLEAEDERGDIQRFVVHRPTLRDQLKIGVNTAQLVSYPTTSKGGDVTPGTVAPVANAYAILADAVATLSVVIDDRPALLPADVGEWIDDTLIANLYSAFGVWLEGFRVGVLREIGTDSGTPDTA